MTFEAILDQAMAMLQRRGRVTYAYSEHVRPCLERRSWCGAR